MEELVTMVMEKKTLSLDDALYYIYSSELYEALLDERTKLWYLSTLSLYDLLEKEKREKRRLNKENPKVLLFKMFCIENIRVEKQLSVEEVLFLFSKYNVFSFLEEAFEMLHTQDDAYIVDTVLTYVKKKKKGK